MLLLMGITEWINELHQVNHNVTRIVSARVDFTLQGLFIIDVIDRQAGIYLVAT